MSRRIPVLQWKSNPGDGVAPPPLDRFTPKERALIARLRTPLAVQRFLFTIPYNWGHTQRSPRMVLRLNTAHCLEGALTAAMILEQHGHPPLLLDMESQDDLDHLLFLYRGRDGRWGTVGRSRDAGLHGRKPVFASIRELVMSYVDPYVDLTGRIVRYGIADLRTLAPGVDWRTSTKNLWALERALIAMPHRPFPTSDRAYSKALAIYKAWREENPKPAQAEYYSNRHQWLR